MPALYEVRWLPDGPTERFVGSRGNYYEFSESDRLDLHSVPVWCHECARITHGEYLPTLDEIDQRIRDLHDPTSVLYRMTRDTEATLEQVTGKGDWGLVRQRLAEAQRRRRWRESRQAPPKCIHCGSTQIIHLPEGRAVPNPGGKGELQLELVGMCDTSFNQWFFTPEGDRMQRDTRPGD